MNEKVLRAMDVELSEIELNNLMLIADKNGNGMIEYKEFIPIGAEVLHGLVMKQETERALGQEEVIKNWIFSYILGNVC